MLGSSRFKHGALSQPGVLADTRKGSDHARLHAFTLTGKHVENRLYRHQPIGCQHLIQGFLVRVPEGGLHGFNHHWNPRVAYLKKRLAIGLQLLRLIQIGLNQVHEQRKCWFGI